MGLLNRLATRALPGMGAGLGNSLSPTPRRNKAGLQAATDPITMTGGEDQGLMPTWNGQAAVENGYYQSVWVMRAAQVIADTIASLPFCAGPDPRNPAVTDPNAPLTILLGPSAPGALGGPNPAMSARAFWAWSIVQKIVIGKMAWELQIDQPTKRINGLWPLVAYLLEPVPVYGGAQYFDGYFYQTPLGRKRLDYDRVMYAWRASQRDPRQPESILESAGLAVSVSVGIERHMWSLLRNGMVARHVISSLPLEESDQRRAWEEKFVAEFTGFDNAGKPIFNYAQNNDGSVKDTLQVTPIATSPVDAQLLQLADAAKNEVLVAMGVPESMIGNASQRIFANADAEYRSFWTTRVLGMVTEMQDDVNTWLAPRLGEAVGWFDLSRVVALQPPQAFAQPALKDMLDEGVVSIGDAQRLLGVNTTGGLDTATAPVGEEDSLTGAGSLTRSALRMETRTFTALDGRTGTLPAGWRALRTPANTYTLEQGSAWRWTVLPGREQVRVRPAENRRAQELLALTAALRERRSRHCISDSAVDAEIALLESALEDRAGVCTGPGPCDTTPIGQGKNWVTDVGGLPLYIRAIAQALIRSGHRESDAIQLAVGVVQRWARGEGKVTAATRARAAKALAEWEAKKAAAGHRQAITESSSAGDLLPVGQPVPPVPRQAQLIGPHRFITDPGNARRCLVCGQGPLAKPHRREARHGGPGHAHVVTGHVKAVPARARQAVKAAHTAAMAGMEDDLETQLREMFGAAETSAANRLAGKRGRQMLRGYDPETRSIDPSALFDPSFWTAKILAILQAAYTKATGYGVGRVRDRLGDQAPSTEADSLAASQVRAALTARAQTVAAQITQTTYSALASTLAEGMTDGEGTESLADRVAHVFGVAKDSRSRMIARTEANSASNIAADTYANALPLGTLAGREWLAVHDSRTRDDHRLADGQRQPMGVPFRVGGYPMSHPGDPTAPPSETVNCRCTSLYLPMGESHLLLRPAEQAA